MSIWILLIGVRCYGLKSLVCLCGFCLFLLQASVVGVRHGCILYERSNIMERQYIYDTFSYFILWGSPDDGSYIFIIPRCLSLLFSLSIR